MDAEPQMRRASRVRVRSAGGFSAPAQTLSAAGAFWARISEHPHTILLGADIRIAHTRDSAAPLGEEERVLEVCATLESTHGARESWTVLRSFAHVRDLASNAARAHIVAPEGRVLPDAASVRACTADESARSAALWLDALLCTWQREDRWARVFRFHRALSASKVSAVAGALERFLFDVDAANVRSFADALGASDAPCAVAPECSRASVYSDGPVDYDDRSSVFGSSDDSGAESLPSGADDERRGSNESIPQLHQSAGEAEDCGPTPAQSFKDMGAVSWLSAVLRRSAAFQAQAAAVVTDTVWPHLQLHLGKSHARSHRRRASLGSSSGAAAAAAAHARTLDGAAQQLDACVGGDLREAVENAMAPSHLAARMHSRRGSEASTFSAGSAMMHFRFSATRQGADAFAFPNDGEEEEEEEGEEYDDEDEESVLSFDERDELSHALCPEDLDEDAELAGLWADPEDRVATARASERELELERRAPVGRLVAYEETAPPGKGRDAAFALFAATIALECDERGERENCWSPVSVPDTPDAQLGFMESANAYTGSVLDGAASCIQTREQ